VVSNTYGSVAGTYSLYKKVNGHTIFLRPARVHQGKVRAQGETIE
jgi:hypothetical protein